MDVLKAIRMEWEREMSALERNIFFEKIRDGSFNRNHYAMFLREEYFNTTDNPESLALATFHLKVEKRRLNKNMLRHAMAESGHNLMALEDLTALGFAVDSIPRERALCTTEAFSAYFIHQVQHRNPLSFLAYIYHLESIAASRGGEVGAYLKSLEIPAEAMSFLMEHATVDIAHIKWNEEYFTELVREEADLEDVIHGIRAACKLHGIMLKGIVEAVDNEEPAWLKLASQGAYSPAVQAG